MLPQVLEGLVMNIESIQNASDEMPIRKTMIGSSSQSRKYVKRQIAYRFIRVEYRIQGQKIEFVLSLKITAIQSGG